MAWFQKLCRQAGLAVHHVVHPEAEASSKTEVRRSVEEERVSPTVTLRRTTIEEVEIKPPPADPEPS